MSHTLSIHFSKLIQDIQPPNNRLEQAKLLPNKVRDYLSEHPNFKTLYPHSRLVGSYAQHLSVGDVKDVDFLVLVDGEPEKNDPTAREVLKSLKSALEDMPDALGSSFSTERNRRSVHVAFEDEDFHLDVVPCIAPDGVKDRIFVPDWGFTAWIESHPLGVVTLIKELEEEHPGKFRNLTKLLKHWRNTQMIYLKPKSYWLVAMVIDAVGQGHIDTSKPLSIAFDQLLNHLYDKYLPSLQRTDDATPDVRDPILDHVVSWNWSRNAFVAFMNRLDDCRGWSGRALDSADKGEAIHLWRKVFGDEFPETVEDYAGNLATSGQPGDSFVSPAGLISPRFSSSGTNTPVPTTRYYGREKK